SRPVARRLAVVTGGGPATRRGVQTGRVDLAVVRVRVQVEVGAWRHREGHRPVLAGQPDGGRRSGEAGVQIAVRAFGDQAAGGAGKGDRAVPGTHGDRLLRRTRILYLDVAVAALGAHRATRPAHDNLPIGRFRLHVAADAAQVKVAVLAPRLR